MKTYKDFEKRPIGDSDIASLTVRYPMKAEVLNFGSDGSYSAYIVTENAEIGEHYRLVSQGTHWAIIYDEFGKTFSCHADEIMIYRAGGFGCIIQLIGNVRID